MLDWYRFTTTSDIDPKQGIYGNKHLEVWIDINARMPAPLRVWACNTLRAREKVVLGGQNTLPFYSCQPGFGAQSTAMTRSQRMIDGIARGAVARAAQKGASEAQTTQLAACVTEALNASLTDQRRAALDAGSPDTSVMSELAKAGAGVSKDCLAKAGL